MNSSHHDLPAILGGPPIRPAGPPVWPRDDGAVRAVLRAMIESGDWGRYHGPHVPELCRGLAGSHGVEHALVCCSGTAAVELALRGVGVQAGDEVILAAYDFKANFQNVLGLHAVPVLVDLDPVTWQLDPSRIEAALTPKTRAVIISHLHGGVVDAPRVRQISDARGIAVVEDACQNPGATLFGRRAGTWGDVGVLSFGGSKLLTAGRGGAILTSKPEIAERIKRHVHRGNEAYPLSEMQAAVLCPQIDELDALNERRRAAVMRLVSQAVEPSGLTPLQLPTDDVAPAYYKVGFKYRASDFSGLTRDQFVSAMRAEGIAFDAGFRSNHLIHASRRFRATGELLEATQADAGMLTLHHPILLESDREIDEIVEAIAKIRAFAAEFAEHGAVRPDG
jgi:perosamine synthetase